jgi:hypothetical protein
MITFLQYKMRKLQVSTRTKSSCDVKVSHTFTLRPSDAIMYPCCCYSTPRWSCVLLISRQPVRRKCVPNEKRWSPTKRIFLKKLLNFLLFHIQRNQMLCEILRSMISVKLLLSLPLTSDHYVLHVGTPKCKCRILISEVFCSSSFQAGERK